MKIHAPSARFARVFARAKSPSESQRGASYLEAAISLPIFFLFIFFIVDLARYFFVYAILNYAAYTGVDLASKLEVEANTTVSGCATDSTACTRYAKSVAAILDRTTHLAHLVASPADVPSGARLTKFYHYVPSLYSSGQNASGLAAFATLPIASDAALLRPGEAVCLQSSCQPSEIISHDLRPWGTGVGAGWPAASENWAGILETQPVEVRIEADFAPVTPFFPHIPIRAVQYAYRSVKKAGRPYSFPAAPTNAPSATPSPSPTATQVPPTDTPTVTPTASQTPTATITPTTTQSPTATVTPTQTGTPTITPTSTVSPTATVTPTATLTPTTTNTPTITPTATNSPTPTVTATGTVTPTPTSTSTSTRTPTVTPTSTNTPTATVTPTSTSSPTPTASPTVTPTSTATPTATVTPTATRTPTVTPTATITPTSTITPTATASPTATTNPDCATCACGAGGSCCSPSFAWFCNNMCGAPRCTGQFCCPNPQ